MPCEIYFGTSPVVGEFEFQAEPVTVAGASLAPGWYCRRCLQRAKRAD